MSQSQDEKRYFGKNFRYVRLQELVDMQVMSWRQFEIY
jgi:hypothetical protein